MSDRDIQTDILLFLEKSLKETVLTFLPKKENNLLPPDYLKVNTPVVFYDYIFVIEKLLNTHIIPDYYSPLYSTKIVPFLRDDFLKIKIKKKLKYFETSDKRINNKSVNILPKSSYRYFNDEFHSKEKRYNIDYLCDAYGIRHTHLMSQNDDCLLFYALTDKNIILLSIGTHKDIYENDNLRTLINEFPESLDNLGIHELTGLSPGVEERGQVLKMALEKNVPSLPSIDGKVYTTAYRTLSGVGIDIIKIFNEIIFQIKTASIQIIKSLGKDYNLFIKKAKSKLSLKYGYIFLGDRVTNKEWSIYIAYFEKYQLIEMVNTHLKT